MGHFSNKTRTALEESMSSTWVWLVGGACVEVEPQLPLCGMFSFCSPHPGLQIHCCAVFIRNSRSIMALTPSAVERSDALRIIFLAGVSLCKNGFRSAVYFASFEIYFKRGPIPCGIVWGFGKGGR